MYKSRALTLLTLFILFFVSSTIVVLWVKDPRDSLSFFSVILIPDTQQYAEVSPKTFWAQTRWVVGERENLNVVAAIHLGDIVQTDAIKEWQVADAAYDPLDAASIPYSVTVGNHDLALMRGEYHRDASRFNTYFGPDRFEGRPWYGGYYDVGGWDRGGGNENNYIFFEAAGMEFMVVSLELGPRDEVLQWANEVIAAHPWKRVIIATHSYLCYDDTRVGSRDYPPETADCWAPKHFVGPNTPDDRRGADGEEMWHALVKQHANIFMVVSGHTLGEIHGSAGYLFSTGVHGNPVHQILANYQISGMGWLRVLRFVPDENKIYVEADTPLRFGRYTDVAKSFTDANYFDSPEGFTLRDDPEHTFALDYEMRP